MDLTALDDRGKTTGHRYHHYYYLELLVVRMHDENP